MSLTVITCRMSLTRYLVLEMLQTFRSQPCSLTVNCDFDKIKWLYASKSDNWSFWKNLLFIEQFTAINGWKSAATHALKSKCVKNDQKSSSAIRTVWFIKGKNFHFVILIITIFIIKYPLLTCPAVLESVHWTHRFGLQMKLFLPKQNAIRSCSVFSL